jgi:glutamine synthetase
LWHIQEKAVIRAEHAGNPNFGGNAMSNIPVFNCKNADDVMKAVKDYDVSFIQYWFVDILGTLKSFQITPNELEASFEEGMGFDGSSILGF